MCAGNSLQAMLRMRTKYSAILYCRFSYREGVSPVRFANVPRIARGLPAVMLWILSVSCGLAIFRRAPVSASKIASGASVPLHSTTLLDVHNV